ncbi:transketolase [Sphingomonas sp.]|uniref:transketolase n=1 Tax=Sphingomonas sp. TaxID=28214 RepID=UPI002E2FA84F|nr:transketolase [Sphingomonas sp.]HEX4695442.1 transketolase [Sphingomonas sp.]
MKIEPLTVPDTIELALRLRRHIVRMCSRGGSSHVGSGLSMADVAAVLYGHILRLDPGNPGWPGRDRFVLSKGHAGACVYAALAERGFFPVADLDRHYVNGSNLSGHLSHKGVPGVEFSTGSLGHGLGIGAGMALQLGRTGGEQRVFVVLSDGECDEGSNWEAILFAAHHRLSNLCAVIDHNKLQSIAPVSETLALKPFADKWRAFGWAVERIDGHDHDQLKAAFEAAAVTTDRPTCIIADTVKGRGVSFMENQVLWHYRSPQGEEFVAAMRELGVPDA